MAQVGEWYQVEVERFKEKMESHEKGRTECALFVIVDKSTTCKY